MKYLLTLIYLFSISTASLAETTETEVLDFHNIDFQSIAFRPLKAGFQDKLNGREPLVFDLGHGQAPVYAYELPEYTDEHQLLLLSTSNNKEIFYPIVILLTKDFKVAAEIKKPLNIKIGTYGAISNATDIPIHQSHRYLLITTDPALVGKSIQYHKQTTGMAPIYSGNNLIYIWMFPQHYKEQISFTRKGKLSLFVPYQTNYKPFIRQEGILFGLGYAPGSEKVAGSPDGTDYYAGSGAICSLGYSAHLIDSPWWTNRIEVGYRYQGGKGRSSGLILETSLVFSQPYINIGAGIHGDLINEVKDTEGNITRFKDWLGPVVFAEFRLADTYNIGVKYVYTDYEDQAGNRYDGSQFSFYLQRCF